MFYCQVPGCLAGFALRDCYNIQHVKGIFKDHYLRVHPAFEVVKTSIVTMLKPQVNVAAKQKKHVEDHSSLNQKISSFAAKGELC